jgi:hypothetical protein
MTLVFDDTATNVPLPYAIPLRVAVVPDTLGVHDICPHALPATQTMKIKRTTPGFFTMKPPDDEDT